MAAPRKGRGMTEGERLVLELTDIMAAHTARSTRLFERHEARMQAIAERQTQRTNEALAELRLAISSQGRA